jgi:hypothetical protein
MVLFNTTWGDTRELDNDADILILAAGGFLLLSRRHYYCGAVKEPSPSRGAAGFDSLRVKRFPVLVMLIDNLFKISGRPHCNGSYS